MPPSSSKKPARYAIKGRRAGETYVTPVGVVTTHHLDGGAVLTDEQKKYFGDDYGIVRVADEPPQPEPEKLDARAQARIAENAAIAASQNEEERRLAESASATAAARRAAETPADK